MGIIIVPRYRAWPHFENLLPYKKRRKCNLETNGGQLRFTNLMENKNEFEISLTTLFFF